MFCPGLCRSSEIFGVSEFVVASLRHTKEKAFENLSVTAHKWIPIKEVTHDNDCFVKREAKEFN